MNDLTLNSVSIYHAGQRTDLEVEGEVTGFNLNGDKVCTHNEMMDRLKALTTIWKLAFIMITGCLMGSACISGYIVYQNFTALEVNPTATRHMKASSTLKSIGFIYSHDTKTWIEKKEFKK